MTSRNVLVTGGAGYVGAHACKALAKAGFAPFVYDNLSTGHESFVRWGPLIKADIRDHATLREAMLAYDISAVLHCTPPPRCFCLRAQAQYLRRLGRSLAAAPE